MDIQEIKNFAKNKIEADDLAKQVRRRIKETAWEKQNQREGFSETFKPLISQFEKPGDSKKENIFTQNQEMLRNQLALTEGLRANQLALTESLKDNQLALMEGLNKYGSLYGEKKDDDYDDYDNYDPFYDFASTKKQIGKDDTDDSSETDDTLVGDDDDYNSQEKKEGKVNFVFDVENNFNENDRKILKRNGYGEPKDILKFNDDQLADRLYEVSENIKRSRGEIAGKERKKDKNTYEEDYIKYLRDKQQTMMKYEKTLKDFTVGRAKYIKDPKKTGEGIINRHFFSPQELLKRFELLSGSLAAGNNGVLHEYIQIAHRLKDLGIVSNNQLNSLLRNYLNIR